MEGLANMISRRPLSQLTTKDVKRKGTNIVKDSLYQFKRLSTCSWDEFDISTFTTESNTVMEIQKLKLKQNRIKLNLYPSEGQPCACVCSWDVALLKKAPGKDRKCKIVHTNRAREIRAFTGRITIFEDKIAIWGTIKDGCEAGEDFELTLTTPVNGYYADGHLLEGVLLRGNRKKKDQVFEQTHDAIVLS